MDKILFIKPVVKIIQVCVDKGVTDKEILEVCNNRKPTGTTNGWTTVVRDKKTSFFANMNNEPIDLPTQCVTYPDREHLFVLC